MELRMPTPEQLRTVYAADLKESFPASELKPLRAIEQMWADGRYYPWCLFDGDEIVGTCFLWRGHPGWALLDYLCVSSRRRNGGIGAVILEKMLEREQGSIILGESEAPVHAPDPAMARDGWAFMPESCPNGGVRYGDVWRALQDALLGGCSGQR